MRRITLITAAKPQGGGAEVADLWQPESLWESHYRDVMDTAPAEGPLFTFWKHYYGASAEMLVEGADLLRWSEECEAVLARFSSQGPLSAFLRELGTHCLQAHRLGAGLQVIAD
ncbi:hypothetical protein [Paracidovorax anthurii]|uniref:Uncharacterized protein n=1 Tax=Paracidovorax anthurii TaxID=78229 RepID=A0A328Z3L1_9BURK|nr:hypothetical protein [Paracidovorax anthurii]RAR79142.1 hypothetical protein AX018_102733 [Paracidovorax anthurii]